MNSNPDSRMPSGRRRPPKVNGGSRPQRERRARTKSTRYVVWLASVAGLVLFGVVAAVVMRRANTDAPRSADPSRDSDAAEEMRVETDQLKSAVGTPESDADKEFLDVVLFDPNEVVGGRTISEWGATWWTWALTSEEGRSPIQDATGEFAAEGQPSEVWLLAGNYGGVTRRKCRIPSGRPIFFPVLTSRSIEEKEGANEHAMRNEVMGFMDDARDMQVEFDGRVLRDFTRLRAITEPFPLGSRHVGLAEGYWVMMRPLNPGVHQLRFRGRIGSSFSLDVSYELVVDDS